MGKARIVNPKLTFFVVAGESSGDRLGAALMQGLIKQYDGEVDFLGVGGPLMEAEGLQSLFPMDELSIMGIAEILPKIMHLLKRVSETAAAVVAVNPTALITIDSPDFSFRVAKKVKAATDIPVIHYVSPSVWAWRPKRAAKMAEFVDHVLALLPFEPPYMQAEGMSCDFVGHPITEEPQASVADARALKVELGISEEQKVLTLLPGSRSTEVTRLAPVFRDVAAKLKQDYPNLAIVIPSVGSRVDFLQQAFCDTNAIILDPRGMPPAKSEIQKRASFKISNVALAASGTVSLELSAAGTPMVIAYKMHWLTAFIKSRLVTVSSATLTNILTKSNAIPEFLLDDCTVEKIYPAVKTLLEDSAMSDEQRRASAQAMQLLGKGQGAENKAAQSVLNYIKTVG